MPLKDGQLPVLLDGHPICQIRGGGSVQYRPENMITETFEHPLQKATDTAETVSEYMHLMEAAPILKAQGLDEDYKQLADFNGVVLAGHPTRYGVQFVAWDWDYGKTSIVGAYSLKMNVAASSCSKHQSIVYGSLSASRMFGNIFYI